MDKGIFLSQVRSVYQNVENNRFPKFRVLRDNVTDAYVETFLSNENDLMEMVNFIYHFINDRVEEFNRHYLLPGETVLFFFKGGNIMFFWRRKIENIIGQNSQNASERTKVSDNDFTIYILTNSQERYNEIYLRLKPVINKALLRLGEIFDGYFQGRGNLQLDDVPYYNDFNNLRNFLTSFYTRDKIQRFQILVNQKLNRLSSNINGTSKKYFREEGSKIKAFTISRNNNCQITPRKSFYLYPSNKGLDLKDFGNHKFHYLSINQNIFNDLSGANHLISFDLYRIKFNLTLDNCLKSDNQDSYHNRVNVNNPTSIFIPSEFIDISIPKYFDYNLKKMLKKYLNNPAVLTDYFSELNSVNVNGTHILRNVKIMSLKYLTEDLLITLFSQNQHNPLLDPKYEKRIYRLFYFYLAYRAQDGIRNGRGRVRIPENFRDLRKFLINSRQLNNNNLELMLGKQISDFFEVKEYIKILGNLINFTVIFDSLRTDDDLLEKYLKYYNESYNVIERIDLDRFKRNFDVFKNSLNNIYLRFKNYFFSNLSRRTGVPLLGGELNKNNDINVNINENILDKYLSVNDIIMTFNPINFKNIPSLKPVYLGMDNFIIDGDNLKPTNTNTIINTKNKPRNNKIRTNLNPIRNNQKQIRNNLNSNTRLIVN